MVRCRSQQQQVRLPAAVGWRRSSCLHWGWAAAVAWMLHTCAPAGASARGGKCAPSTSCGWATLHTKSRALCFAAPQCSLPASASPGCSTPLTANLSGVSAWRSAAGRRGVRAGGVTAAATAEPGRLLRLLSGGAMRWLLAAALGCLLGTGMPGAGGPGPSCELLLLPSSPRSSEFDARKADPGLPPSSTPSLLQLGLPNSAG